ncbi:hypothetical protein FACS189476_00860 [Spirochaetia bacterium]|nr:hypothetical protein FACS189476_00860 [Spirochaetia bacterium]
MGQKNKILVNTFGKSALNLVKHQSGKDTYHRADYYKKKIVEYGIAGNDKGIGCRKEITEILKTDPGTFEYPQPEIDPLEGDYEACHGEVIINEEVQ